MIVNEEQLLNATGYTRPSDAKKCLEAQGVRVYIGKKGRIFTTTELFKAEPKARRIKIDGE